MKKCLFALVLFCTTFSAFSQVSYSIKGTVSDTASGTVLYNATIAVLNATDSTLVQFSRANEKGTFAINDLIAGNFLILVTYPRYADYIEPFHLDSLSSNHDFGDVNLILKAKLLEEVVIKGRINAIEIKGDTTEFNAAAYHIAPNSKVEDLLKQLPGLQVDWSGKITAHGKVVKKVLVDGEEFFSDDPKLVTRNLRGDMIEKVQLYDKKSDQATLTGIDDGIKEKTINLQLKEDKKKGYFGEVAAGGGTNKYYQARGTVNYFNKKVKVAAYGSLSNMNGSQGMAFGEGGGEGLPRNRNGGAHYDTKWDKERQSANSNYFMGSTQTTGASTMLTQNNLATGIIKSSSDERFSSNSFYQRLDGNYEFQPNKTSNFKIDVNGYDGSTRSDRAYNSSSSNGDSVLLNNGSRVMQNKGDNRSLNANEFWSKKFKKTGRTISLMMAQTLSTNNDTELLKSVNTFYKSDGSIDSTQLVDQQKNNDSKNSSFRGHLMYTEPLSKTFSLAFSYAPVVSINRSARKSFNKSESGEYDQFDREFSSDFELTQIDQTGGADIGYNTEKIHSSVGIKVGSSNFKQNDLLSNSSYQRSFLNLFSSASLNYSISSAQSLNFSFSANTIQPSLSQLQPVKNNNDPLNIRIGNPGLKPALANMFSLSYNSYRLIGNRSIYLLGSYGTSFNPIVSNTTTTENGVSTYQDINLDKQLTNFEVYSMYSQGIGKSKLTVGLDARMGGNTYYNLINSNINKTTSNNFGGNLSLSYYKTEKLSVNLGVGPSYTVSKSSLQKINNNGWSLNSSLNLQVYLPKKFMISSNIQSQFQQQTQSFNEPFKRTIWNMELNKRFLKNESLKLSATVNDLLNQNKGFNRSAESNMITQRSFTMIRRYLMLTITYEFNKMGGLNN